MYDPEISTIIVYPPTTYMRTKYIQSSIVCNSYKLEIT